VVVNPANRSVPAITVASNSKAKWIRVGFIFVIILSILLALRLRYGWQRSRSVFPLVRGELFAINYVARGNIPKGFSSVLRGIKRLDIDVMSDCLTCGGVVMHSD